MGDRGDQSLLVERLHPSILVVYHLADVLKVNYESLLLLDFDLLHDCLNVEHGLTRLGAAWLLEMEEHDALLPAHDF